jgi:hypothetical protein
VTGLLPVIFGYCLFVCFGSLCVLCVFADIFGMGYVFPSCSAFIPSIFSHSKWINNSTMAYIPSIFFYISIQVRIYINFIQRDSMPVVYLNSSILIR